MSKIDIDDKYLKALRGKGLVALVSKKGKVYVECPSMKEMIALTHILNRQILNKS